jgi:serine protease AprX
MARCVIAYPMHEYEHDAVRQAMPDGSSNGSVIVGQLDDGEIERLREQGVLIQVFELAEPPATPPSAPFRFGFSVPRGLAGPAPTVYRLRLNGPLFPPARRNLEQLGVEILEGLPQFALKVRIPVGNVDAVNRLGFVAGPAEPLAQAESVSIFSAIRDLPPSAADLTPVPFDVLLLGPDALQPFLDWLRDRKVAVDDVSGTKVRLSLEEQSPLVSQIGNLKEWVACIEQYVPPKLYNDMARQRLGIDCDQGCQPFPFEGEGQIVAVADTGLDDTHPDFANRIVAVRAWGRPPANTSDPIGHGTHVAGSLLGDGAASGGKFKGTAPKARLFFQSLLDQSGGLGGLPLTLDRLLEEAYQGGARIHNNSWGTPASSEYRIASNEVDEFVHRRKDMLVVICAGNEGSAADPAMGKRNVPAGYVDFQSIGAPATCKNALTVGASRSGRREGGWAARTYGSVWPAQFPCPPIATALISADPQAIGGFSSRGPCLYRIKPDVIAPGTDILSCRSSLAADEEFWGPYPLNPRYAFMGGTSMATPLVSGCAALVREYYIKTRKHQPSAALVKATLINGTVWLSGQDAVADYPQLPNYHQGFGAVHLPSSIPTPRDPAMMLEFVDNWNDPPSHLVDAEARFKLGVAGGRLRLCLAYTDAPGSGLQNNLNLLIQVPGVLRKRFGNENLPRGFNGPDPVNNVEVFTIDDAPPGDYLIQIKATNLIKPPQDFALVATGRLTTPFRPD